MKKLIALLILSPLAFSQELKFKSFDFALSCKVTDQVLIETEDGKAKRYSSYEDDLKTGDIFKINFELNAVDDYYRVRIKADAILVSTIIISDATKATMLGNGVTFTDFTEEASLTENYISVEGPMGHFNIKRYYKNDWDLMTSEGATTTISRTLVANCMGMPKEFDEMLELMAEIEGDKWFDDGLNKD